MKKVFIFILAVTICSTMFGQKKIHWGVEAGYDHAWLEAADVTTAVGQNAVNKVSSTVGADGFHIGPTFRYDFLPGRKHVPSITVGLYYQFLASDCPINDGRDIITYRDDIHKEKQDLRKQGYTNINLYSTDISHAIQIPVAARYTFHPNTNWGIYAYTGPMLDFFCARYTRSVATAKSNGKKTGINEYTNWLGKDACTTAWVDGKKEKQTVKEDHDKISNVFNVYWNVGVGAQYKKLSFGATYEINLNNQSALPFKNVAGVMELPILNYGILNFNVGINF